MRPEQDVVQEYVVPFFDPCLDCIGSRGPSLPPLCSIRGEVDFGLDHDSPCIAEALNSRVHCVMPVELVLPIFIVLGDQARLRLPRPTRSPGPSDRRVLCKLLVEEVPFVRLKKLEPKAP